MSGTFQKCLLLLMVFYVQAIAQDDTKDNIGAEKCNVIQATIANVAGWRKGDFLMTEEVDFDNFKSEKDKVSGVVVHHQITRRVAFDLDKSQFAMVVLDEQTITDFGTADPKPRVQKKLYGFSLNSKKMLTEFSSGKRVKKQLRSVSDQLLNDLGYVDLRGFWYRGRYNISEYSQAKRILKGKIAGFGFLSGRRKGDSELIEFAYPFDDRLAKMTETFCIDQQSLMVTSRKVTGRLVAGGQYCEGFMSDLKWKSIGEIQVPIKARFSDASQIGINNRLYRGVVEKNVTIDWISLNEPPEETLFSDTALRDTNWMLDRLSRNRKPKKAKIN